MAKTDGKERARQDQGAPREDGGGLKLVFRALADSTRLRLLHLMTEREICVGYLVEVLRISQPKVSRHLAYLRRAGMVRAHRNGKWMHYSLRAPKDAAAGKILAATLEHLRGQAQVGRDMTRLKWVCGNAWRIESLKGAPPPLDTRRIPPGSDKNSGGKNSSGATHAS
jgi:ArsR family transcriptional regulator, arsenate/arsenite/antimonite-responsive transcriptional repressor